MKPILVHLHIYYPHLYDEFKQCILNIAPHKFDLFVTMVEEHSEIISDIRDNFPNAKIEVVENRGYDVGPFIYVLNQVNLDDYEYVVKIHTKSDKPQGTKLSNFNLSGDKWRKELLGFISNWQKSINLIDKNKKVGMVAGTNIILMDKEDPDMKINKKAKEILSKYGITLNKRFDFVAGTMFLARSCIFKPIQYKFSLSDFELVSKDGYTLAHILERVFGILVSYNGYIISDNMELISKIKTKRSIKNIIYKFCRFILQKKISHSNVLTIKFLRIPVYRRKINY